MCQKRMNQKRQTKVKMQWKKKKFQDIGKETHLMLASIRESLSPIYFSCKHAQLMIFDTQALWRFQKQVLFSYVFVGWKHQTESNAKVSRVPLIICFKRISATELTNIDIVTFSNQNNEDMLKIAQKNIQKKCAVNWIHFVVNISYHEFASQYSVSFRSFTSFFSHSKHVFSSFLTI